MNDKVANTADGKPSIKADVDVSQQSANTFPRGEDMSYEEYGQRHPWDGGKPSWGRRDRELPKHEA